MDMVIVGAGTAGARAVEALRKHGHSGAITLIGAERELPYLRPPLSKDNLHGKVEDARLFLRPAEWYAQQHVALRLNTRAVRLDIKERRVHTSDGASLAFDKLLIATGCHARKLEIAGAELKGVYTLRTLEQSHAIAAELSANKGRVVIIGAGFIGLEIAAAARLAGREVTVLEQAPRALGRSLDARLAELVTGMHRARGVELRFGQAVQKLEGTERVERVVLADGTSIGCDLVIAGIGVVPSVEWLDGSGVALDNGVLTNERCETNVAGVYAAGDVANAFNPLLGERQRVEHDDNAHAHGMAAGKAMAGVSEAYAPVPFFWSDQYEHSIQFVGRATEGDTLVWRGEPQKYVFSAFFLRDGKVGGAFAMGKPRDIGGAKALIKSGKVVDATALANETNEVRSL